MNLHILNNELSQVGQAKDGGKSLTRSHRVDDDIVGCDLYTDTNEMVSRVRLSMSRGGLYQMFNASLCLCKSRALSRTAEYSGNTHMRQASSFFGAFILAIPLVGVEVMRFALRRWKRQREVCGNKAM
jgi:hypothetical protein